MAGKCCRRERKRERAEDSFLHAMTLFSLVLEPSPEPATLFRLYAWVKGLG